MLGRDSTGHEVDILMNLGDRLVPAEVAADATDTLVWWSDLAVALAQGAELPIQSGIRAIDP